MQQRVNLEPSYVLHTRPYRSTSLLIEIFSHQYGKLALLARSARGLRSRFRNQLQLFTPLLLSWTGRQELKSLTHVETQCPYQTLQDSALVYGFYVNELLQRLLHRDDPCPPLYDDYQWILQQLNESSQIELALRLFEKRLLQHVGYALPLHRASDGSDICATGHYQFIPEHGFVPCHAERAHLIFAGDLLLALQQEQLVEAHRLPAKRLMRVALSKLLGNRPIKSRDLV